MIPKGDRNSTEALFPSETLDLVIAEFWGTFSQKFSPALRSAYHGRGAKDFTITETMGPRGILVLLVAFALAIRSSISGIRRARHFEANLRSNSNVFRKVFEQRFRNNPRSSEAVTILELPGEGAFAVHPHGQSQLHK